MKYRMLFIAFLIPGWLQAADLLAQGAIYGPFIQELSVEEPAPQNPLPPEPAPEKPLPPVAPEPECQPSTGPFVMAHIDELDHLERVAPQNLDPGSVIVIVDEVINIGEKIWKIVEANKPIVNVKRASASAVPSGITCWMDLETWQMPVTRIYEISYKNSLGMNVATFKYAVNYTYGGSIQGVGSYLTNVNIVPMDVSASWGFKMDAEVSIPSVINMGTRNDPIAGMQISLKFKLDSPLKAIELHEEFFVTGEGEFTHLGQN